MRKTGAPCPHNNPNSNLLIPDSPNWHIFSKTTDTPSTHGPGMLILESHTAHERHLPSVGKFVIAQFDETTITVYQAFNESIAAQAVQQQRFGGGGYDFDRITWLKPSFLWMMYYSGWAQASNQEAVLAITLSRDCFDSLLQQAVLSDGKAATEAESVLQWETYHDLLGNKTDRQAAKIGLRGAALQQYNDSCIQNISNITEYVRQQQALIKAGRLNEVRVPAERAYAPTDLRLLRRFDATSISL